MTGINWTLAVNTKNKGGKIQTTQQACSVKAFHQSPEILTRRLFCQFT